MLQMWGIKLRYRSPSSKMLSLLFVADLLSAFFDQRRRNKLLFVFSLFLSFPSFFELENKIELKLPIYFDPKKRRKKKRMKEFIFLKGIILSPVKFLAQVTSLVRWIGASPERLPFFVVLACHLLAQDGFDWHYQAYVHLPLSWAVNKSLQYLINFSLGKITGNAENRTGGCWVRSANFISVLCPNPCPRKGCRLVRLFCHEL